MSFTCEDIKDFMNKLVEVRLRRSRFGIMGRLVDCNERFITIVNDDRECEDVDVCMRKALVRLDEIAYIAELARNHTVDEDELDMDLLEEVGSMRPR
ncbi:hypothetical protein [Vulcanisaeta distributa]|uniref:hypothetical protein n=1 Tax=Vulcanisaeta distributa TaxID=164451 RepID=UPI0006D2B601|nr:hypothetical protein [Vulcanisaeta distributa]